MRSVLKSGYLWRFAGGFAFGTLALVTMHPSATARPVAPTVVQAR